MAQSDLDNIAYNKFANGEITLTEYIKYQNRDKIMEKKEAMKILKDFRDKSALFSVRTALDIIIPELKEPKESEDEKIRKEIIYFLSRNTFQFGEDINKYKSWIAWLEKQDKTFTKKDVDDAYLKGVCNTKHELEKKSNTNKTINKGESAQGILRGAAINLITWIDYNAAEGNMCLSNMECKDIEDALVSGNWDKIYAYIKKKLEKQDNKSVNIDIESMVSSYKQRLKSQGGVENSPLVNMCLTAFRHGVENTLEELNLKEVEKQGEQKPTIFIPKFRVGDIVKSKSQPMLDARKIISIGKDYYLCEDRGCIGFAWEDDCELVEPKQEWSEEDEKMFNKIAVHLNATCSGFPEDEKWANEFLNWFKTLKERVQFQPRQEWSEEDKNMLQSILDEYKSMPTEKRNWLKSLKERVQPQQKVEWSEEDETYSNHVITAIKSYYTDNLGEENPWREELLRWLKSLRPQLTWKPSKEQMITLRHVISGCSYDIDPLVELETKLKEL